MKSNKILTRGLFVLLATIYLPVTQACEQVNDLESENLLSISTHSQVTHNDTESYSFKEDNCGHAQKMKNNLQVNVHSDHKKMSSTFHKS